MKMKIIRCFVLFFLVLNFWNNSSAQKNITYRSNLDYPGQTCANVWGYVDSLGNEYALVGASLGLSIVNVTNPDAPFEVGQVPGPNSLWKEVETFGKYAYVVSEGGSGLQIIDLSKLPANNFQSKYWQPLYNGDTLKKAHTLHIDNGYAYLYGGTYVGALICNLADPWNPVIEGLFSGEYIHDGYVRNNILYAANIYAGHFSVMDVSDKANPTVIGTPQITPGSVTHNTWLSDDSKTLFTTDEVDNSFLTSYDVTDPFNISELDQIQSNPGSQSIIHNCHVKNDWVVCSYYKDGVVIFDGHRPGNLVQVGNYDTDVAESGGGYGGAWGAYPFLPSGNILVTNIFGGGLYVLTPDYKRAAYLEGIVTDSVTGLPINTAGIQIQTTSVSDSTKLDGTYAVGLVDTGTYSVQLSKAGYITKIINSVSLQSGKVITLDVKLKPVTTGIKNPSAENLFTIYPNPSSGFLTLDFHNILSGNSLLSFYTVLGTCVLTKTVTESKSVIDVSQISKGVYFIEVETQGVKSVERKKIIIQ